MMQEVALLSSVTASIAFTITETKLFAPLLEQVKRRSSFLGELFSCDYCLGHWIAFGLVAMYRPRLFHAWWLLDYFLTALVIAWVAAFQRALLCGFMEKAEK